MREKAKQLVTLLKDEERLREERIHALKTKEKMAQTSSGETALSNVSLMFEQCFTVVVFVCFLASSAPSAPSLGGSLSAGSHSGGADPEQAWPQSSGEEDLQLQLALAMSKEEAEQVTQITSFRKGLLDYRSLSLRFKHNTMKFSMRKEKDITSLCFCMYS